MFRSTRISLQLINGLVLTDFNVRPVVGILCPTNFNLLNQLENLSKSGQNALFHFLLHLYQKDHPPNRLKIPATDFPAA